MIQLWVIRVLADRLVLFRATASCVRWRARVATHTQCRSGTGLHTATTPRALQGNCTGQPWPQVSLDAPLLRGQCVILIRERLLYPETSPGQALWLSNLYVRSFPSLAARSVQALGWAGAGNRLWVTSTTLESNKHRGGAIAVSEGAKAYASGVHKAYLCVLWAGAAIRFVPCMLHVHVFALDRRVHIVI